MKDKFIKLDKDIVKAVKELFISENVITVDCSYYAKQTLAFKITDSWYDKNNEMLVLDLNWEDNLSKIMNFILRCNPIKDSFINKYNVKKGHINLLRSCYFYVSENVDYITLNYKRPFGNSGVEGDILFAFDIENKDNTKELEIKCEDIFDETINILVKYLVEEEFEWFLEANYQYSNFEVTENYKRIKISEERKRKINILLS